MQVKMAIKDDRVRISLNRRSDLQVLLVRRAKEPQKGLLTFPGGSLELGETMVACAIRETLEETGLALRNTLQGSFLRGWSITDC